MKSEPGVRARARGFLTLFVFSIVVAGAFAFVPTSASAATIAVQTQQVVPGTGTCAQPTASGFVAYAYDGHVDSFDIDVSDPAYVAVAGTVGDTAIPFPQMRRQLTPSGTLHIHTDIESTPLSKSMPVSIVLLSAKGVGAPICLTQVTVTATAAEQTAFEQIPQTVASTGSYSGSYTKKAPAPKAAASGKKATTSTSSGMSAASATVAQAFGRIKDTLQQNACGSRSGTSRLWFIFLVLYVLALGAIALSRPPSTTPYPLAWLVSAIVIPIFLLISFWYVLSVCGVSRWIPIVAVIAGLVGIAIALRGTGGDDTDPMLLLEQEGTAGGAPETVTIVDATAGAAAAVPVVPAPAQPKLPVEMKEPEKPVIVTPPPAKPAESTSSTPGTTAPAKEQGSGATGSQQQSPKQL